MTSEGQHAGQQAEATSGGGGTEPAAGSAYGAPRASGGYPPDGDDQPPNGSAPSPQAGWGTDAYPNSYGPPPYPSSGSGSPFVVPAVRAFSTSNGDAPVPVAPSFRSSAQVPAPTADAAGGPSGVWGPPPAALPDRRDDAPIEPHPYRATTSADGQDPGAFGGPARGHPYRDDADGHPYRSTASASGSASVPMAPRPEAPSRPDSSSRPEAPSRLDSGDGTGRDAGPEPAAPAADNRLMSGGPLPSRADRPPFGGPDGPGNPDSMSGFNGFVRSSPARGNDGPAGAAPAAGVSGPGAPGPGVAGPGVAGPVFSDPDGSGRAEASGPGGTDPAGDGRAPGISAFGGQRVRVPGAALSGLPDTPPAVQAGKPADSSGFHLRGRADAASHGDQGFGALPQPRTPAEPPPAQPGTGATGTARPVTASASVPVASRVTPPSDGEELPVSGGASPRPRVYGRSAVEQDSPATADDPPAPGSPFRSGEDDHPYGFSAAENGHPPDSHGPTGRTQPGYGFHDADPAPPTGRATASARVTPPSGAAAPFTPSAPPPFPPPVSPATFTSAAQPFTPGNPASFTPGNPASFTPGNPASFSSGSATSFTPGSPASSAPDSPAPFAPGNPASFMADGAASFPSGAAAEPQAGRPYSEHTTDMSRRGRARTAPADQHGGSAPVAFPAGGGRPGAPYSEHTTDVSGRGGRAEHPYGSAQTMHAAPPAHAAPPGTNGFPASTVGFAPRTDVPAAVPAGPGTRADRQQLGGVFPGPTSRPTVTPPEQAATSSWPAADGEQGRTGAFKPDGTAAVPAVTTTADKTETPPNVRMLPVLLGVILAAALLVGMAIGVVWLIARPADGGFDVNAGDCVKRDGDKAVTTTCGDPGSFQVVSKVDKKEQCADPGQPYVVNPAGDGRSQVLCLKPTG